MSKNFRETLAERMRDPEFKAEWDALAPEHQTMRATIEEREDRNSAQQFTEITGIVHTDIRRLENDPEIRHKGRD